jgi:hypothetical protein
MSVFESIKKFFAGREDQSPAAISTSAPAEVVSAEPQQSNPSNQEGVITMNEVKLSWTPNAPEEGVKGYNVYQDEVLAGSPAGPELAISNVAPGMHKFEVAAVNIWGEGPKSDPVFTPAIPTKVGGVSISINISVNVAA